MESTDRCLTAPALNSCRLDTESAGVKFNLVIFNIVGGVAVIKVLREYRIQ